MSSHREAPEITTDPVADNTDVYLFVSPDRPDTVTLIANYIPIEAPDSGPYFYRFGDDVLYAINIDNNGDSMAEISYQFRFNTQIRNPDTFLYNTGPITSLDDPNWNMRQFYTVTRVAGNGPGKDLASGLSCPPANIGPRSTPNYPALAQAAIHTLPGGEMVFAGPRAEGFFVDVGSIFDLGGLRPFNSLHLIPLANMAGVNGLKGVNVHTIALQIPKTMLTRDGSNPTDVASAKSVIGVFANASRQKSTMRNGPGAAQHTGPWVQVSRLANPLINEVVIPVGKKDLWNSLPPSDDAQFTPYAQHPELAKLLPVLYPKVFPNLAGLTAARADLVAILQTGIPSGIIPGFQNFTGAKPSDLMRLNMAIPPAKDPNALGILGGDLAGFPNGRRVTDDVVTIELRAIAGVTYPLIDKSYTPDAAATKVTQGVSADNGPFLTSFPYLGTPNQGYDAGENGAPPMGSGGDLGMSASGSLTGDSGGAYATYQVGAPSGNTTTLTLTYTPANSAIGKGIGLQVFQNGKELGDSADSTGTGTVQLKLTPASGSPLLIKVFNYINGQAITFSLTQS